jgi:opacity protein-like surface antigen
MRKVFLRSIGLVAIGVSVAAHAADLPVKAPLFPVPPYNWSGAYAGANLGGAWTSGSLNIPNNSFYGGLTEFIAGVQAGYNFQAGIFYLASKVISMERRSAIQHCRLPLSARSARIGSGQ